MSSAQSQSGRRPFEGVTNIVRFNPNYFVSAGVFVLVSITLFVVFGDRLPGLLRGLVITGISLAAWWSVMSLVASWWIYDQSALYRWSWLPSIWTERARVVAVAHAGFDEVSGSLRERLPGKEIMTVDFYDPDEMTEKSIQRARRICPPDPGAFQVGLRGWKLSPSPDLLLFTLSAHEWRAHSQRVEILSSAKMSIADGGAVILVEHLKDPANFVVFGPGFLHFHSERTWRRAWQDSGLVLSDKFRVTPFLGVFILVRSGDDE